MKRIGFILCLVFLNIVGFSACTKKSSNEPAAAASTGTKAKVHLAIWSNFVTPEMLEEFTATTGYPVEVSNYSSNEELLAKLQAGASGYDVAVPADYMVTTMAELGLLEPLNRALVPHSAELDPKTLGLYFDPENRYSLPFDFGTTGIGINRDLYKGDLKTWKQLFTNPDLVGKYSLMDDVRESLGAALKMNGHSLNSTNEAEIEAAKKILMTARKGVKAYTSETKAGLINGDMAVAHAYSSDVLQARAQTGGKIEYVIPEEGCTYWVDALVIPKGSKNAEGAHALINYLVSAPVQAKRADVLFLGPANKKSLELVKPETRANALVFPTAEQLAKCEMLKDVGDFLAVWDRSWTEVRASR